MSFEFPATIGEAESRVRIETRAFIDGRFVPAASGKTLETINPATGRVFAEVAECDAEDVDRAVRAARDAFEDRRWAGQTPFERKKVLLRLAEGQACSHIAVELSLSPKTVSTYRARLMAKLGLHTNAEVTYYAIKAGLVA